MQKLYEVWEMKVENGFPRVANVDLEKGYISVGNTGGLLSHWNGCGWQEVGKVRAWAEMVVELCEAVEEKVVLNAFIEKP